MSKWKKGDKILGKDAPVGMIVENTAPNKLKYRITQYPCTAICLSDGRKNIQLMDRSYFTILELPAQELVLEEIYTLNDLPVGAGFLFVNSADQLIGEVVNESVFEKERASSTENFGALWRCSSGDGCYGSGDTKHRVKLLSLPKSPQTDSKPSGDDSIIDDAGYTVSDEKKPVKSIDDAIRLFTTGPPQKEIDMRGKRKLRTDHEIILESFKRETKDNVGYFKLNAFVICEWAKKHIDGFPQDAQPLYGSGDKFVLAVRSAEFGVDGVHYGLNCINGQKFVERDGVR